jgi:hypothetical protein
VAGEAEAGASDCLVAGNVKERDDVLSEGAREVAGDWEAEAWLRSRALGDCERGENWEGLEVKRKRGARPNYETSLLGLKVRLCQRAGPGMAVLDV